MLRKWRYSSETFESGQPTALELEKFQVSHYCRYITGVTSSSILAYETFIVVSEHQLYARQANSCNSVEARSFSFSAVGTVSLSFIGCAKGNCWLHMDGNLNKLQLSPSPLISKAMADSKMI